MALHDGLQQVVTGAAVTLLIFTLFVGLVFIMIQLEKNVLPEIWEAEGRAVPGVVLFATVLGINYFIRAQTPLKDLDQRLSAFYFLVVFFFSIVGLLSPHNVRLAKDEPNFLGVWIAVCLGFFSAVLWGQGVEWNFSRWEWVVGINATALLCIILVGFAWRTRNAISVYFHDLERQYEEVAILEDEKRREAQRVQAEERRSKLTIEKEIRTAAETQDRIRREAELNRQQQLRGMALAETARQQREAESVRRLEARKEAVRLEIEKHRKQPAVRLLGASLL